MGALLCAQLATWRHGHTATVVRATCNVGTRQYYYCAPSPPSPHRFLHGAAPRAARAAALRWESQAP